MGDGDLNHDETTGALFDYAADRMMMSSYRVQPGKQEVLWLICIVFPYPVLSIRLQGSGIFRPGLKATTLQLPARGG
jgi:hypothetical protein